MYIYLIQHGEAKSENIDPDRSLTDKGKSDASKTADFMKKSGMKTYEIWHSTKLRAKQTAKIIAKSLSSTAIEVEGLKPNDPVAPFVEKIKKTDKDVAIIGHLPFLQKLTSLLLTGSESNEVVLFKQGGLICLQKIDSYWCIAYIVTPDLLI